MSVPVFGFQGFTGFAGEKPKKTNTGTTSSPRIFFTVP